MRGRGGRGFVGWLLLRDIAFAMRYEPRRTSRCPVFAQCLVMSLCVFATVFFVVMEGIAFMPTGLLSGLALSCSLHLARSRALNLMPFLFTPPAFPFIFAL